MKSRWIMVRIIAWVIVSLLLRGMPHAMAAPAAPLPVPAIAPTEANCHDHGLLIAAAVQSGTADQTVPHGTPLGDTPACKISCAQMSAPALLPAPQSAVALARPVLVSRVRLLSVGLETPPDHPPPI